MSIIIKSGSSGNLANVDAQGNLFTLQTPAAVSENNAPWTSATALDTTYVFMSSGGWSAAMVQINTTSTITAGEVTYEATFDGVNWQALTSDFVLDPITYIGTMNPHTLTPNTNYLVLIPVAGAMQLRVRLSQQIVGTGNAIVYATLQAKSPLESTGRVTLAGSVNVDQANSNGDPTQGWYVKVTDGTNTLGTALHPIVVDGSGVTQPVSGTVAVSNFPADQVVHFATAQHVIVDSATLGTVTVTGSVSVSNFPATQNVNVTEVGGSALALGQTTMADSVPVAIASDQSALHVIVDSGGGSPNVNLVEVAGDPVATAGTGIQKVGITDSTGTTLSSTGGSLNVNVTNPSSGTADQGSPNTLANGWPVKVTDGTDVLGTATHPIRTDPTGTTTQPVSGTVAVSSVGGTVTISGTVTANAGTGTFATSSTQLPAALDGGGFLKVHEQGTAAVKPDGSVWTLTSTSANVNVTNASIAVTGTVTANAGTGTFTTDPTDRAARLLGVVYGSQGQQVKQTAVNFNLATELFTGATAYDARQIRALTSSDQITVANASIPVTQSGTWNIGTVTTLTSITNAVTVTGTVAATQSGTWSVRMQDGTGNALTSDTRGSAQALAVEIVDASGNQITTFGTPNASVGTTGSAVPASATYIGVNIGGNLVAPTGLALGGTTKAPTVAIVDGSGNQITSFGGGTQFADNAASGATPTGTLSMGWDSANSKVRALKVDASQNLLVAVNAALPAGTNVIGHVITDSGSTTAVTGNVTVVQGTGTNLHTVVDSGTITSITNPVTVAQATAANLNATVVGTGTFAVQATLAAETTKVIGTVRNLGNAGAIFDGVITAATAPANMIVTGGVFNTTLPTLTTGQSAAIQVNSKGVQLAQLHDGTTAVTVISGNNALKTDLSSVGGTNVTTAAAGVQKVGLADGSGNNITSTTNALDVNLKSGSATLGVGATGAAIPANAVYSGFNSGGNLVGVSSANPFPITIISSSLTDPAEVAPGTTAPTKIVITGGKTNDGTPQYQYVALGPGGRSTIVEGISSGVAVNTTAGPIILSAANSSTTPLTANSVFTGTAIDATLTAFTTISIECFADQNSATNGLQLQWSKDGSLWSDHTISSTVTANQSAHITSGIISRYCRVVYTNGTVNQGAFRLSVFLNSATATPTLKDVDTTISSDDIATTTRSIIVGKIPSGAYTAGAFDAYGNTGVYFSGGAADAFGRGRVSSPQTLFNVSFEYDAQPLLMQTVTSGTGTVAKTSNQSSVTLNTGGTASGATATFQSKGYYRYEPGKSQLVIMSGIIGTAKSNVQSMIGYFDANNGLFFNQNNGIGVTVRTSTSGAAVDTTVAQASWNIDKMDGTGPSGITLDFSKTQIFVIDMQWLGAGRVRFGFEVSGVLYYCHQVLNANVLAVPYMNTANLPIQWRITNTGTAASGTTMTAICGSVVSEGGSDKPASYLFAASSNPTSLVTASTTRTPIISIRPKTTFNSITNRSRILVTNISMENNGANSVEWRLIYNGTLTGASFADVDATNSAVQADTTASAISNGVTVAQGYCQGGAEAETTFDLSKLKIPLTLDAAGSVQDIFTLTAQSTNATTTVAAGIQWSEER